MENIWTTVWENKKTGRERERVCICVCLWETDRQRQRDRDKDQDLDRQKRQTKIERGYRLLVDWPRRLEQGVSGGSWLCAHVWLINFVGESRRWLDLKSLAGSSCGSSTAIDPLLATSGKGVDLWMGLVTVTVLKTCGARDRIHWRGGLWICLQMYSGL